MLPSETLNKVLLIARFILCAMPLTGYIHPDEFFQSPEVMAGDVMSFNTTRTWEWDTKQPARNIIFPGISSGLPFLVIKFMTAVSQTKITSYSLLILPRIVMTVLTYIIDIQIEKISHMIYSSGDKKADKKGIDMAIFLYRSSVVTLVFLTRTFSNTFEAALFAMLLWVLFKQLSVKEPDTVSFCRTTNILTAITTIGFFIRPTFLLFAVFEALIYLVHLLRTRQQFILQMILGLLTLITFGSLAALADSLYFSWNKNFDFNLTPINLIKYNLDEINLRLHGEHPRFLHLLVNCPLLFGPLSLVFLFATFLIASQTYHSELKNNMQPNRVILRLVGSLCTAVLLLSYFKHQEPRYLVPIITPMCLVSSWFLMKQTQILKPFMVMWLIFNTMMVTWFGFVHQGGIIPSLSYLNNKIYQRNQTPCTKYNILFWYTYMAPSHLLAIPNKATLVKAEMRNLGSLPEENLTTLLHQTFNQKEDRKQCPGLIYVAMPATVDSTKLEIIGFQKEISFFPHVSIEAPPWKAIINLISNYLQTIEQDWKAGFAEGKGMMTELRSLLSLDLYRYKIVS